MSTDKDSIKKLLAAAEKGDEATCLALLDSGVPLDAVSDTGLTALLTALVCGKEKMARVLMGRGANLRAVAGNGSTALHYAVQSCSAQLVVELLDAGLDINAERQRGTTPAMLAAQFGRLETLKALGGRGADILGARVQVSPDEPGQTCLTAAASAGHEAVIGYLLTLAWPAEALNVALKHAAMAGHMGVVEALCEKGADPFVPAGANQKSALDRARSKKQTAIVDYFKTLKKKKA